jgi:tetratricopeptide (TPR) repeat protein
MGWGGSVSAMIASLRSNKELLNKKKPYFNKKAGLTGSKNEFVDYEKATPEELNLIKRKLQVLKNQNRIKTLIVLIILSPFIFFVGKHMWLAIEEELPPNKGKITMQFYSEIKLGDEYFKKGQIDNAIIMYERADELVKRTYLASLRLAIAYSHQCLKRNEMCSDANWNVKYLYSNHREDSTVLKINSIYEKITKYNNLKHQSSK